MGWLLIPPTDFKVADLLSSQSHVMYHVYHYTQYIFSTGQTSLKWLLLLTKENLCLYNSKHQWVCWRLYDGCGLIMSGWQYEIILEKSVIGNDCTLVHVFLLILLGTVPKSRTKSWNTSLKMSAACLAWLTDTESLGSHPIPRNHSKSAL